ncbi:MAG TPA: YggT family protein [Alphaproteobacteria bacterium]|nr:YggT family protein [Alphaproteobacteria bacterium]
MGGPFWQFWYFHIPNYLLAMVIYTLLGRFLLGFLVSPDSSNYIWRWFRRITDPFVAAAGGITPRIVPGLLLPPIAAAWLFALRLALGFALLAAGLAPGAQAG